MSELAKALLEFQKNAPELRADATNPHFGNKFVSLESLMSKVLPAVNSLGLIVSQFPTTVVNGGGARPALRTLITHADSGETIEDVMLLMPGKDDPQGQGSAITYARRYSLMAALGLVADEDDDGNAATRSGAGDRDSSRTAPASDDTEYLAAAAAARLPGAIPSQVPISFGKNKGTSLGNLTLNQLRWYAEDWKVQDEPSDYDLLLKAAAVALYRGDDAPEALLPDPDADIPFE